MHISSQAFQDGGKMPHDYTCDALENGSGMNPPLLIEDIPDGAKTLVLTMEDLDSTDSAASPDGIWDHWVVYNIPVQSDSFYIEEGQDPEGEIARATSGVPGYIGPCPHEGEHRYVFTVYAIAGGIDFPEDVLKAIPNKSDVLEAIQNKILATATLTGRYSLLR